MLSDKCSHLTTLHLSKSSSVYLKTQLFNHVYFLQQCLKSSIIPKGFRIQFHHSLGVLTSDERKIFEDLAHKQAIERIRTTLVLEKKFCKETTVKINQLAVELKHVTAPDIALYKGIRLYIHLLNRDYFSFLSKHKSHKLQHLKLTQLKTPSPLPSHSSSLPNINDSVDNYTDRTSSNPWFVFLRPLHSLLPNMMHCLRALNLYPSCLYLTIPNYKMIFTDSTGNYDYNTFSTAKLTLQITLLLIIILITNFYLSFPNIKVVAYLHPNLELHPLLTSVLTI